MKRLASTREVEPDAAPSSAKKTKFLPPKLTNDQSATTTNQPKSKPIIETAKNSNATSPVNKVPDTCPSKTISASTAANTRKEPRDKAKSPQDHSSHHKIRKLVPPRPFATVPTSVSATGPRSAHFEGKNYLCITRKTNLGAYLRRCKELVINDG